VPKSPFESGRIPGTLDDTWRRVDSAFRIGLRRLPGDSSLPRLLAERRGVRNLGGLPRLTLKQVLVWADAYRARTEQWPKDTSGSITDAPGESWHAVDRSLRAGVRGFRPGSSLPRLLAKYRRVRNHWQLPHLTVKQILTLADAYHTRTGSWPLNTAGRIIGEGEETWGAVNAALYHGRRGLPGGATLAQLLAERRGVRNLSGLPCFTRKKILAWADAHYRRIGKWPTRDDGLIADAPGETWAAVNIGLSEGKYRRIPDRRGGRRLTA
jgi:hypothetical protein